MNLARYKLLMIETKLGHLLIGTPKPFRDDGEMSAIVKQPVAEAVELGPLGLAGNQVADPLHHGGRDKAVHLGTSINLSTFCVCFDSVFP